jgi:hypothetical protein
MPILLQLAQSYSNPDSVNYKLAYLREQMEQQLLNLGDLAYEDQVQLAMLGETIIVGGYLRTELLAAKSIQAKHLAVEDLAAISAKFTGDVYIGGDVVVGGQGVLSVFQFVSNGFNEGWGDFGISSVGGDIYKGRVSLPVSIPANFSITKAIIELQAMPVYLNDVMNTSNNGWKQSRNLKLYYAAGNEGWHERIVPGSILPPEWRGGTDITSAVLGVASWSPPLQYSGTDKSNTQNKIQYRSGSIINYLTPGQTRVFYVETTDSASEANSKVNIGQGRLVVTVEGYAKPV